MELTLSPSRFPTSLAQPVSSSALKGGSVLLDTSANNANHRALSASSQVICAPSVTLLSNSHLQTWLTSLARKLVQVVLTLTSLNNNASRVSPPVTHAHQLLSVWLVTTRKTTRMYSSLRRSATISVPPSQCPHLPKYALTVKVHVQHVRRCPTSVCRALVASTCTETYALMIVPSTTTRIMTRWSVSKSHLWISRSLSLSWQWCAQYSWSFLTTWKMELVTVKGPPSS